MPRGVRATAVSYDDPSSLATALAGQDVLVITMSTRAPRGTQDKLIEAAAAAGVKFVLPNEWGIETAHGTLGDDTMGLVGGSAQAPRAKVEALGKSAWIGTVTGYWFAHSLSTTEAYGFDLKNKSVTFFDEGTVKINMIVSAFYATLSFDLRNILTRDARKTDLAENRRSHSEASIPPDRARDARPTGSIGLQEQERVCVVVADEPKGHVRERAPRVRHAGVRLDDQVRACGGALRGGEAAASRRRHHGLSESTLHEDVL